MKRTVISFFALCALVAGTTDHLVERSFAPKKTIVELNSLSRLANSSLLSKKALPEIEYIEAEELTANDFIPVIEDDSGLDAVATGKVSYEIAPKSVGLGEAPTLDLAQIAERAQGESDGRLEINGEQPVRLYGFKTGPQIQESSLLASFKPIEIEREMNLDKREPAIIARQATQLNKQNNSNDKSSKNDQDRISTALAANEKSKSENGFGKNIVDTQKDHSSDELVFFDYSDKKPEKKEESLKDKVTSLVSGNSQATSNSQGTSNAKDKLLGDIIKGMGKGFENQIASASGANGPNKEGNKGSKGSKSESFMSQPFAKNMNTQNHKSDYRLSTHSQALNGKSEGKIHNFEVRFADDIDDILRANSEGVVKIQTLLNSEYSVRRGTIYASGHYPTTTDFILEGQFVNLTIPLLTEESFSKVLQDNNLTGLGGHVLIELDELTEDVDFGLDSGYEDKLFLDRSMRVVERGDSDYAFILFVGLTPGNHIISFKTYKREVTSKIIHVAEREIYYDFNFYAEVENDEFELYEDNLLSKETGLLSINEDEIVDLSFDTPFMKMTVNRMQAKRALYPVGTRKYYELKHLDESVFIGRWSSDYVDVPSESYIRFALSNFGGYTLENSCLVQINLEKEAKELSYNGNAASGHMSIIPRILDTDGVFYRDLSHQSKRVFLLGEQQGAISVMVRYVDNSVDYLQTFCSKTNYVVEQL